MQEYILLINKRDLTKLKNLHSKGKLKQTEKTTKEWEKIFANNATDKGLISKIYRQFIQSDNKRTT